MNASNPLLYVMRGDSGMLTEVRRCFASLTPREQQVLSLVTRGLLNKQAAAQLGISEPTVKVHRARVMRKMRARSFAELVRMATLLESPAELQNRPL